MAEPYLRRASDRRLPLLVVFAVVVFLAFHVFRHFLLELTVAASVALLLAPVHRRVTRALGNRPSLAAGLLVLLCTVLLLLPVFAYATLLGQQALTFFDWARPRLQPAALQELWQETLPARFPWIREFVSAETMSQIASAGLSRIVSGANAFLQGAVAGLTSALLELGLFLMTLYFFLRDGNALRHEVRRISPLSDSQEDEIVEHLVRTVKGVLLAMVVVPIAQGLVAIPGFHLLGVPSPLLWGVTVVLASFVPILGSPLAWLPAVAYLFVYGSTGRAVGMLLYGVLVISGIDNLIKPALLRGSARIHPLLGFLSILGGILSFGPLGFMIGPVILSLGLSALRIYTDFLRVASVRAPAPGLPAN